jgi:cytosine/adenosine deaminase-related metal-dependent hydrolase
MRGGCLVVCDGRIVGIEKKADGPIDLDLEDSIVLPGLINGHTHLEFSGLESPLPTTGGFVAWIRRVIDFRRERWGDFSSEVQWELRRQDLLCGLKESWQCGTVAIADIATSPYPIGEGLAEAFHQTPGESVSLIALGEVLGWTEQRRREMQLAYEKMAMEAKSNSDSGAVGTKHSTLHQHLEQAALDQQGNSLPESTAFPVNRPSWESLVRQKNSQYDWGVSPHAPYSTSPRLIQWCIERSRREQRLLAMHLGETLEEMEWLARRSGMFGELLERLGVGPVPLMSQWGSCREYLIHLSRAWRALVVHANYLSAEDWEVLVKNRGHMSVVYCPRTHRYFGHDRYPLAAMRQAGVRVLVGTDSRASNPDLSVWEELKTIAAGESGLSPADILDLGTLEAAAGLGIDSQMGAIELGRTSRVAVAKFIGLASGTKDSRWLWERLWDPTEVVAPVTLCL